MIYNSKKFSLIVAILLASSAISLAAFSATAGNLEADVDEDIFVSGNLAMLWSIQIVGNILEEGAAADQVFIEEHDDASDGPPADVYDTQNPPTPPSPPWLDMWLDDNLASPKDALQVDARFGPDTYKVYNLTCYYYNTSWPTTHNLQLSWNNLAFQGTEYMYANLTDTSFTVLADMMTSTTYTMNYNPFGPPPQFHIILEGAGGANNGSDCASAIPVSIPGDYTYTDIGQTTCGLGDDYDATDMGLYDGGEDIIYEITVTSAQTNPTHFNLTADTTYTGMGLFDDCPDIGTLLVDVGSSSMDEEMFYTFTSPGTYYLMIDTWPAPDCINSFDLTIEEYIPGMCPVDTTISDLNSVLPYADSNTTCGAGDDFEDTGMGYYDGGEDFIYEITVSSDVEVTITMDPLGTTWTGIGLFSDCPDIGTLLDSDTGSSSSNREIIYTLLAAESPYYLMIDIWPTPECYPFDLTIEEYADPCESAIPASVGLNSCPGAVQWYTYTPSVDCDLEITSNLMGQSVDTDLEVYDACGGTLIASMDDDYSGYYNYASTVLFAASSSIE
jgi:hypothetical protein